MHRNDAKNKQAFDKVTKARAMLVISQPFFGALALHLTLVEEQDGKLGGQNETMWTNGTQMGYFPAFVLGLPDDHLEAVIAHEVMHNAYKHPWRRQHRNHVIWNMAGDYVINSDIRKAGFKLPEPHLYDPKFDGQSTEDVYEQLKKVIENKIRQQLKQQGGGNKQKGQQGGKGQQQGQGGGGTIVIPDTDISKDLLNELGIGTGDKTGEVRDAAGSAQEQSQSQGEMETSVRMAANTAKRANAGRTPGFLERLVGALAKPAVDWRDPTRQFIDQSMNKDYSWSRPNRRMVSRGLYLPGFISDALHHMVFVADTSGSISKDMLMKMGGEVAGALYDNVADKITVVYADTKVQHVDEYVTGDEVKFEHYSGGGTAFADTFKWIAEHAADAQCIIYLTDMLTSDWGEDIGIPTLWAAYLPKVMLDTITPPFGAVIQVDTSE